MSTYRPYTLSILLCKLRSYFAFGVGLLIVFVTLDSVVDCIADSISKSECIVLLHFTGLHLLCQLVLCNSTSFLGNLRHGQIYQFVVSLSFLFCIRQISSFDKTCSLIVSLSLQDSLQFGAVPSKCSTA